MSVTVGRPREEVFDYLADMANHSEFTDHFLEDFHLTRENTVGRGAGARFRVKAPLQRFSWMGVSFVEVDRPRRIVEAGRGGKYNRIRSMTIYSLEPGPDGTTRVADEHRDRARDDHRSRDGDVRRAHAGRAASRAARCRDCARSSRTARAAAPARRSPVAD